jgi:hypothetical protein
VPGMDPDGLAGLGDQLAVPPQAQFAVEDPLHGEQPLLREARYLVAVQFVGVDVAEERLLPQGEGRPGQPERGLGVVLGVGAGEQVAEVQQVERVGVGVQPVSAGDSLDGVVGHAVLGEQPAQPQHAGVQRGLAAGGRTAPPDDALEEAGGDDGPGVQQEGGEE